MDKQMNGWQRIGLLVALTVTAGLAAAYFLSGRQDLKCVFHEFTGLYCPGCGSTRTIQALLHGDWGSAFRYNVLFLPLGIPAALVFVHEWLRLVFPAFRLKPVFLPQWLTTGCCVLVFLFWILRNLPVFAFLAP